MTVLQVCAFGAEHPGNFIASLEALELVLASRGIRTIYAFVERAADKEWCKNISKRTAVYFLPEAKARILPKTYQVMRRIYAENQVDIVHTHFELYDIPATVTAPKSTKVFWHLHDALKANYEKASSARKILTKLQYGVFSKRCTLLSVSKEHARFAVELGFPKNQVIYFPNGINTSRIDLVNTDNRDGYFLQFGWEIIRKGVDLVVEAAKLIKSDNVKILIVGQEKCAEYLRSTNSANVIQYSAPVSDVNTLFRKAKAFLHVSRAEGLSYALLEVIYAGIPVICSDIPENAFAHDFRNVFFVKSGSAEEIAYAIDCMSTPVFVGQESDIHYNRALIRRCFSLESWVKDLLKLYLE